MSFRFRRNRAARVAILVGLVGCGGGGTDPMDPDAGPPDASPACEAARGYQDFTSIQTNIFTRQCSFMDCHDSGSPEAGMDLTGADAHMLLVNHEVEQSIAAGWLRVVPNDPQLSYLMVALGRVDGTIDPDVGTMPQNSPLLCTEKIDAIERWILAGAPND
jgi:hypothetical protein